MTTDKTYSAATETRDCGHRHRTAVAASHCAARLSRQNEEIAAVVQQTRDLRNLPGSDGPRISVGSQGIMGIRCGYVCGLVFSGGSWMDGR